MKVVVLRREQEAAGDGGCCGVTSGGGGVNGGGGVRWWQWSVGVAVDEEEEEPSEDEDEEDEEHLALADSALSAPDYIPLAEETEPFETDEPIATPPPTSPHIVIPLSQTRLRRARISKRVRFTAPSHRFKIRKSSTAVTTRQTGPALTHGVDYGFIDTLDASTRATNERVMNALEGVNERMTDLASTYRHYSEEFYTRY
nr:hypothetical protein [Tanacetum cinerariifolium]